jgi:hypothetical protein
MRRPNVLGLVVALVVAFPHPLVLAQSAAQQAKKKPLPKSGLLAVSSISGAGTSVVGDVFGNQDIFGTELPPIAGSVSRRGDSTWSFSVINNSTDRYSVNVDLVQKNETGAAVKFSSYSYTLRPGQRDGEEVAAGLGARRAELTLRSYRNLTEIETAKKKSR